MVDVRVKICGLRRVSDVAAVAAAGAAYAGFVFFPKSPRHLSLEDGRSLALAAPPGLAKVALTVDADDALLDAIIEAMPIDMLQLHGHETPDRVSEVRARYGLPVMKAVGVASGLILVILVIQFNSILNTIPIPKYAAMLHFVLSHSMHCSVLL